MPFNTVVRIVIGLIFLAIAFSTLYYVSGYKSIIVSEPRYHIEYMTYSNPNLYIDFDKSISDKERKTLSIKLNYESDKATRNCQTYDKKTKQYTCNFDIELRSCTPSPNVENRLVCKIDLPVIKPTTVTTALLYSTYNNCDLSKDIVSLEGDDNCRGALIDYYMFTAFTKTINIDYSFTMENMGDLLDSVYDGAEVKLKGTFDPRNNPSERPYFGYGGVSLIKEVDTTNNRIKYVKTSGIGANGVRLLDYKWIKFEGNCGFDALEYKKDCTECETDTSIPDKWGGCNINDLWERLYQECSGTTYGQCEASYVDCDFCFVDTSQSKYKPCHYCKIYCYCGGVYKAGPLPCVDYQYAANNIPCDKCKGDNVYSFTLDTGGDECTISSE